MSRKRNNDRKHDEMRRVDAADLSKELGLPVQDAPSKEEKDDALLPILQSAKDFMEAEALLLKLDARLDELEANAAFHELSEKETAFLNLLKTAKRVLARQMDQIDPKLAERKSRREALGSALRVGYWVGTTKIRALPENHPWSKELRQLTKDINKTIDEGFVYINNLIAEQTSVCEDGGFLEHEAEVESYRKQFNERQ